MASQREILQKTEWGNYRGFVKYRQVKKIFNDYARLGNGTFCKYDRVHRNCTTYQKMYDMLSNHISKDNPIIDFGCGSGLSGKPFIDEGFTVDGIDFADNLTKFAKKRGYRKIHNINLVAEDRLNLGCKYDVALSTVVAGDWIPDDILIPKMIQVLKPESTLGLTVYINSTDRSCLENVLKENNLHLVEFDTAPQEAKINAELEHYFVVAVKK